ncbi:helix-turn-helix transcriptional regulator [Ferroplasma sp.]|uniref:helix-turn-helix transcriptional regulator n=1 Tax=Ferroplasma sp. TaxID=2591003 RepID=UPI00307CD99C
MEELVNDYLGNSKSTILSSLLYDDKTLDQLSGIMNVNKNAVNEHINYLENHGLVASYFVRAKAGRPKKFYKLTEKGMEIFPKQYINFSSMLLKEIEKEFGSAKLNTILMKIAEDMIKGVSSDSMSLMSLNREEKLEKISEYVNILNKLGYYAKMEISENSVKIIRHNCIFYELAKNNKDMVCGSLEKSILTESLNDTFKLIENFPDGDNKCVVEIQLS